MKKQFNFLFAFALLVLVFGCRKDDPQPTAPTMEVSSDQIIDGKYRGVVGSGSLTIELEGQAPMGIKSIVIVKENLSGEIVITNQLASFDDSDFPGNTFAFDFEYELEAMDTYNDATLYAILTDKNDEVVSVEITDVEAYWSLESGKIYMDSDTKTEMGDFNYYLALNSLGASLNGPSLEIEIANPSALAGEHNHDEVHLIFDYDLALKGGEPIGSYLASPHQIATSNPPLVSSFPVKNQTIVKIITYASLTAAEQAAVKAIDGNDVLLLVDLFAKYQPASTSQRVTFNGAQGDIAFVLFQTAAGKIGLITDYELDEGSNATLQSDVWVMR